MVRTTFNFKFIQWRSHDHFFLYSIAAHHIERCTGHFSSEELNRRNCWYVYIFPMMNIRWRKLKMTNYKFLKITISQFRIHKDHNGTSYVSYNRKARIEPFRECSLLIKNICINPAVLNVADHKANALHKTTGTRVVQHFEIFNYKYLQNVCSYSWSVFVLLIIQQNKCDHFSDLKHLGFFIINLGFLNLDN